ncbi:MAG TPA: glutamate 5-kinase [Desulfomonilia bacterium]
MKETNRSRIKKSRRVIVKIGSSSISTPTGLNYRMIERLCDEISMLKDNGHEFAVVSSGAVASGRAIARDFETSSALSRKQALAAIGQGSLIGAYNDAFVRYGHISAQILITRDDIDDRHRYINIRNTFHAIFELGAIPIINENDTVSVEEIQFTDNDMLSAMLIPLVEADLLIMLTDTDGVYADDPRTCPDAKRIPEIKDINIKDIKTTSTQPGKLGRGGMQSKLTAAHQASLLGVPAVIACAAEPHVLERILKGDDTGTLIVPNTKKMKVKEHWLSFISRPKGRIIIDKGAVKMLKEHGKSLLPVGITGVTGNFKNGDPVEIVDKTGNIIAIGLTNFTSHEIEIIKGANSRDIQSILEKDCNEEVVHRNNLKLKGAIQ